MALFICKKCGYLREIPHQYIGKKTKCPVCQQMMPVYNTVVFVKKLLEKHLSLLKELPRSQKTSSESSEKTDKNFDDIDIFNTTALTEKQQYQPILDWFKQKNIQLVVDSETVDTTGFFDEVAVKLGDNYDVLKVVSENIKSHQHKKSTNIVVDLSGYNQEQVAFVIAFCEELYEYAFVAKSLVNKAKNKIHLSLQTAQPIVHFFNGEWLEWFAFMKLLAYCHEHRMNFAGLRSFTIQFPNKEKNELDTFFLVNGVTPLFVECKSGEFRHFIDKYIKLRSRLKIDKKHFFMLVIGLHEGQLQGFTRMFDITFVNEKTFVKTISALLTESDDE